MEKERYKVRVSDDLCFVGVFDLQENKYVVNESVICLDTAHLLCDLFNKVDKQDARIKELEEENNFLEKRNEKLIIDCRDFCLERNDIFEENQQLKEQLEETKQTGSYQVMLMCQKENILLNQQLKQSQNQKAIEELKKIKNYFLDTEDWLVDSCEIEEFIINQIKELEVQNEV